MSKNFILGIEVQECKQSIQDYCIWKRRNGKCSSSLSSCQYPVTINPFCFAKKASKCSGRYTIHKDGKKTYLLYTCHNGCKYFMKNYKTHGEKLLKILNKEYIYYGKDLEKLVSRLFKDKDKNKHLEDTEIIKFFDIVMKHTIPITSNGVYR